MALAEQLTKLIRLGDMFNDETKECARPQNSPVDAATAFQSHPESFEGLSPKSEYWPEVVAIYGRFQTKACEYANSEKLTHYFAEQFAERASEDDLRASIAFFSSGAGKRLQDVTVEINRAFQAYAMQLMRKAHDDAEIQYQREIRELLSRFHGNEK